MLIVTHELQAIHGVLTRIVELDGGRITFDGSSADHDRWHGDATTDHGGHHHDNETPAASAAVGPLDRLQGPRDA